MVVNHLRSSCRKHLDLMLWVKKNPKNPIKYKKHLNGTTLFLLCYNSCISSDLLRNGEQYDEDYTVICIINNMYVIDHHWLEPLCDLLFPVLAAQTVVQIITEPMTAITVMIHEFWLFWYHFLRAFSLLFIVILALQFWLLFGWVSLFCFREYFNIIEM